MEKRSIGSTLIRIGGLVLVVIGVIFIYAFVHEGSHALAVWFFGGQVTRFNVNIFLATPSISYDGVHSLRHQALISLAGPVLPLFLIIPLTFLLPRVKKLGAQFFVLLNLHCLLGTMVSSILIALTHGFGASGHSEDLVKFMLNTKTNAFLVSGIFCLLLVLAILFVLRVGKAKEVYLRLIRTLRSSSDAKPKLTYKLILAPILLGLLAILLYHAVYPDPVKPITYKEKIEVEFPQDLNPSHIYTFTVTDPTTYDFIYSIKTNSDVTLRLVNTDGKSFPYTNQNAIVMYEGNQSLRKAYFTGFTLLPGSYAIEAFGTGKASLTMYIDSKEPEYYDMQFLDLLTEINTKTFTEASFKEPGYELVYQGDMLDGSEQLLVTLPSASKGRMISAVVVGECEDYSLTYVANGMSRVFLENINVTIGFGLPRHTGPAEIWLSAKDPLAKVFIWVKDND